MSGDEICARCGAKFEVDNYCAQGHARPVRQFKNKMTNTNYIVRIMDFFNQMEKDLSEKAYDEHVQSVEEALPDEPAPATHDCGWPDCPDKGRPQHEVKPAPAKAGEWTAKKIASYETMGEAVSAINAALAAEREKLTKARSERNIANANLAAERAGGSNE